MEEKMLAVFAWLLARLEHNNSFRLCAQPRANNLTPQKLALEDQVPTIGKMGDFKKTFYVFTAIWIYTSL